MNDKKETIKEKLFDIIKEVMDDIELKEVVKDHMEIEESEENTLSDDKCSRDIQIRLRRIQGQVKGIEKMIGNEACCKDILVQISAVRAAMNKVGGLIFERYAQKCLLQDEKYASEEKIEELISTLLMFIKK